MFTKTFRAPNMLTALQNVRAEFGSDAMIISMREIPSGSIWAAWRKPGVEVIASKADHSEVNQEVTKTIPRTYKPNSDELKQEIENLKTLIAGQKPDFNTKSKTHIPNGKEQINSVGEESHFDMADFKEIKDPFQLLQENTESNHPKSVAKPISELKQNKNNADLPQRLLEIKQRLVSQGVNIDFIERMINTNIEALSPSILNDYVRLERFIKHQLSASLPSYRKSLAFVPSRIMALTGMSGSGKTSCCAKIASFYMIKLGKKVVWIEADTVRTSAISEARTYTETLGIPLFLAYTPQELSELIESQKDADLILIDTASCNPRNEDSVVELGSYLSQIPSGSIYFVASATTKEQDLIQAEKTFKQFGMKGIILTKMDETGTFGDAYNLLCQSKLPLHFFTTGNKIFGNLKPGTPELMAEAVMSGEFLTD